MMGVSAPELACECRSFTISTIFSREALQTMIKVYDVRMVAVREGYVFEVKHSPLPDSNSAE